MRGVNLVDTDHGGCRDHLARNLAYVRTDKHS